MAALKNSRNIALTGAASRVDSAGVVLSTGGIAAVVFPPNSNTPTPGSITITATTRLYNNPTYVWEFRYGTSGAWTAVGTNSKTLAVTFDAAWVTAAGTAVTVQYRLTVTQTGYNTTQEILSLPLLRSAVSTVVIDLSNDSVTVATNTDGSGGNYSRANTTLSIFSGSTNVIGNLTNLIVTPSEGVTFSFTKNGTVSNGHTAAQTISLSPAITSFSAAITAIATAQDGGTLTVSATYNNQVYIAVFTVTKGKAGENALVYEIEADSQISFNSNTNVFSPASVTYSAYSISGVAPRASFATGTIILESSANGTSWTQISSNTAASATLTTSSLANTVRFVRAKLQVGAAIVDQETDAITVSGTNGAPGTAATNNGTAQLYQWSTAQPANPTGNSTWTWSTGVNSNYTGANDWQTSIPANPQTPGIRLWVAAKQITAQAGTTNTVVDWTTGTVSVYASSLNGLNGLQTAEPTVYQWAQTIPSISGTSLYTWSNGTYPTVSGWSLTPGSSPSVGYTLWAATVKLVASASETQSTINWLTASISAVGYAGTNGSNGGPGAPGAQGASSRLAYARIANNPTPVQTTVEVNGDNLPSSGDWGLTATWATSDPSPTSTNTLYQADGIYNPVTNKTVWSAPYISSLKVGLLSAITVNTGALTVQDRLTVSATGSIAGGQSGFNTGTGFFIGYSDGAYKLSVGNPSGNRLAWDGSGLTIIGSITTGSVINGAVTLSSGTALSTIEGNASSAVAGLANKLDKQSTYILGTSSASNEITLKTSGYDGGNGIVITNTGILGKQGNQTTFAIDNTGAATFKGDISGSSGNFIGTLTVGSGNTVFKVNSDGSIQSGNATFASAPFRVTNTGALTATSATITGTLTVGSVINGGVTLSSGTTLSTLESNASTAITNANTAITNANSAISTANTALANANNALNQLPNKLQAGSSYNLTGVVDVQDSGAIKAGSVTWNSTTGAVTGGTGVVFTENGITAVKNGATTFSLTNAGDATFAGSLSAATGTFSGNLSAAGGTFTGNLNAAGGTFTGNLTSVGGTFTGELVAASGTFSGSLSAATGTFAGQITSGSTATNGVVIGPDGIKVIVGGVVRVRIGNLSSW